MAQTEAQLRASAKLHAERRAAGMKTATFWIDKRQQRRLDLLAKRYGSKQAAFNAALDALSALGDAATP